nr:unnamed protein product [Callosobruchus chinensis]
MEANAMHAAIERRLKNTNINVPAYYVGVCVQARRNPKPYSDKYLSHDFFNNYSNLRYFNSIRPGKKVQDIRALRYNPNKSEYKLKHINEWEALPDRINKNVTTVIPKLSRKTENIRR